VIGVLVVFALAAFGGGAIGYALCLWHQAQRSALLNTAIRDGTIQQYAGMKDGRSADNLPPDRYKQGD